MNSLLEMTKGQTVDHFINSISESEQLKEDGIGEGQNNFHVNNNNNHHVSHRSNHNHTSDIEYSDLFYEASMQKTNNFRSGIAYNPMPIKLERPKPASPVKPKSNLSSFKLISISEESRLNNYQKNLSKRVTFRKKTSLSNSRASDTPKMSPIRK